MFTTLEPEKWRSAQSMLLRGVRSHDQHVCELQISRPLTHFETFKGSAALYRCLYAQVIWRQMETRKKEVAAKFILAYLQGCWEIFPPRVS